MLKWLKRQITAKAAPGRDDTESLHAQQDRIEVVKAAPGRDDTESLHAQQDSSEVVMVVDRYMDVTTKAMESINTKLDKIIGALRELR